jgi:desulfoferrodoxin (superoxide reductase-like protein)
LKIIRFLRKRLLVNPQYWKIVQLYARKGDPKALDILKKRDAKGKKQKWIMRDGWAMDKESVCIYIQSLRHQSTSKMHIFWIYNIKNIKNQ